ncbi:MAG: serine/threonine protein kinase [Planctomycetaceae bacterium]|nr:serine/threonine protein kinase [Planctomycetaceae bacterium]MCP4462937.1 serine/threonine protein kinase [Planctomycetaceae bacterium]MDG1806551.1 serine/threonine-protein kinase [Pirellulaceae bacterium]MDG2105255.1 serine/threonine-protein kinase [Pirellulaceae bacterium]
MAPNQSDLTPHNRVQDLTGRTLGNYVLIRRLGRGGMANVYLAQQKTLQRPVAIKILKPELATDQSYVERFHREAQAAAALSQANIVQIYEVGDCDGLHFIAQEYVRGQNLRQYLNRHHVVEPILAVSIMRQVSAALSEACQQGVIHRDIKPENIMISSNGEVKVTDFGLARVLDDQRGDLTQIGITMGTPLYMSPEQAEGGAVDVRSDLYSMGITAWHMLAGHPPFDGENALTIAVKHLNEALPSLQAARPDLPKDLCEIIQKLTNKRPEDRFQNPAAVTKQLRTLEFGEIADWEGLTDKLAVNDSDHGTKLSDSRLAVTRQLESIMSGHFRPWWQRPLYLGLTLAALVAGAITGAAFAFSSPPTDPLAIDVASDAIPRMETAEAQYEFALKKFLSPDTSRVSQRKLWQSVETYFPQHESNGDRNWENTQQSRRAALRLAELELINPDDSTAEQIIGFQEAIVIFDGLIDEANDDPPFLRTAQAGKAVALSKLQILYPEDPEADIEINELLGEVIDENGDIRGDLRSVTIKQEAEAEIRRRF